MENFKLTEKYFTHLHLHTDYSLLDGAISIDKLIEYGKKYNCKSLAISDHGNIFAAVKFFEKCKKAKIKPVLGIEAYITDTIESKNSSNPYYHLLLLVENEKGYRNLCKLIEASYTKGFYFKPRIDYELLKKYSEGLIATSTCLGGHIPNLLLNDKKKEAVDKINFMRDLFKDRYYLEVQPYELEKQSILNKQIFELEKELEIPVIATGDCHYFSKEDRYAHEVMLAVQTRSLMSDENRMTFGDCLAYMRSPEEMLTLFPERSDIIWRTGEIADKCNFEFTTRKLFFPKFEVPKNFENAEKFFEEECKRGFEELVKKNKIPNGKIEIYKERLNLEIEMICKMGFATYLLIVSDFILWAKNNGVSVGPGRGSVAGALVAWALSITNIDPIKYNLLFERFLNPERISMPDIDVDFDVEGREKVIKYVKDKYGHDKVGQIITFGTMAAKGVIKDVARALGFNFEDANALTELIPDELKITLKDSLEQEPRLREAIEKNPKIAELFDVASRLEGLTRHASKHAAGIVISPEPIAEVLPIYVPTKSDEIVTQYAMTELELLGFLKMDFLGLKNLTLITNVINYIKKNYEIDLDIDFIPFDDQKTFKLLSEGDTSGVFQLESSGIKDVLKRLEPTVFEDIIAVNALYRPGPLGSGMVDDFIERKHGRQKVTYLFPELEDVLKETYGVIVYQEQVMKISSVIGGYSLGEADILRRAMGKKKADEMEKQRTIFVEKSKNRGFDEKKAGELFDLMAYFAGYGFNKSHSAAYALIAYQTAYLKAHYRNEFMACLITLELGNPETTKEYLSEIKEKKIKLFSPNINSSIDVFLPSKEGIFYGLLGIKNLGKAALDSILEERNKNGSFQDLFDFCCRIDLRVCNKRVLENLIVSGTFDSFKMTRANMLANLDSVMHFAGEFQERKKSGQLGLFDLTENSEIKVPKFDSWINVEPWSNLQTLEREKEILGIYLSKHPLDEYDEKYSHLGIKKIKDLKNKKENFEITRGSIINFKEITTKKGDLMAFCTIEDQDSKAELIIFPKIYKKYEQKIKENNLFIFAGDFSDSTKDSIKIKVNSICTLQEFNPEKDIKFINFLFPENFDLNLISEIHKFTTKDDDLNFFKVNFLYSENNKNYEYSISKKINLNSDLKSFLDSKNVVINPVIFFN